jgi:hypothetical protein
MLLTITDAAPEFEAEFNRWYDREHLIDRVGTPGFLSARRYLASEGKRKYLAVYETENIAVFDSAAYKHKLTHQSDWSKHILKQFRNPHRAVARIGASQAFGVGGVASVAMLAAASDRTDALRQKVADKVIPILLAQPDVVAVHLLESDPRLSQPVPEYPRDSEALAAPDAWFLLTEASDPTSLIGADFRRTMAALGVQLEMLGVCRLIMGVSLSDLN